MVIYPSLLAFISLLNEGQPLWQLIQGGVAGERDGGGGEDRDARYRSCCNTRQLADV